MPGVNATPTQATLSEDGVSKFGVPVALSREEAGWFYFPKSYYDPDSRKYRPSLPIPPSLQERVGVLTKKPPPPLPPPRPSSPHNMLSQQEATGFLAGAAVPRDLTTLQSVAIRSNIGQQELGTGSVTHRERGERQLVELRGRPLVGQANFHTPPRSVNGEASEKAMALVAAGWGAGGVSKSAGTPDLLPEARTGSKRPVSDSGRKPKCKRVRRDDEDIDVKLPVPPPLRARPTAPPLGPPPLRAPPGPLSFGGVRFPAQPPLVPFQQPGILRKKPIRPIRLPGSISMQPPSTVMSTLPSAMLSCLPSVASVAETATRSSALANASGMYPPISRGGLIQPGNGAPASVSGTSTPESPLPSRYSESPLPTRHSDSPLIPSRYSVPLLEHVRSAASAMQASQSAPSVAAPTSSGELSQQLDFGCVRVKKEPGLEESEPKEMHKVHN